ncbi:MAG: prepilin-type N-terminal cleavage/methylation domain-containing protein [Fimbriimonadaceae bacterium]|nr:prepilin-type N-terminal cleavage/methylation domain-containing protein [Fimbriimonadaceae bacterium]
MSNAAHRGFTVIEALVAATLLGVGIAATVSGLASVTRAYSRMEDRAVVTELAQAKYDELIATGEWQIATSGTFEEPSYSRFGWTASLEPTALDGVLSFEVIVRPNEGDSRLEGRAAGLARPPQEAVNVP